MSFETLNMGYAGAQQDLCIENDTIPEEIFQKKHVNRGLRDIHGKGVLTGLTRISEINSFKETKGKRIPIDGRLYYRGYAVEDLIDRYTNDRFMYEKMAYLLLFGDLPDDDETGDFIRALASARKLPTNFVRDVIMKAPSKDIMNSMTRSILTLASYDKKAQETDLQNVIRQCLMLTAVFPMLAIYGYHAYNHYDNMESMYIHRPQRKHSTAEHILTLLRPDKSFTETEAQVLDAALVLHMEHGGGNNSTFTTRVITSSGSDTYATIAAAMSSLKGPKHGGANLKVMEMMSDIRAHIRDQGDDEEIEAYLGRMLDGEVFDRKGLIYGMGHAIYSVSDPRERVFHSYVEKLSEEKGLQRDFALYEHIRRLAPKVIAKKRQIYKGVSPNVDFYSGFVYDMLGIPRELFIPIFAIARVTGWSAHRIEELVGAGKIIRPAYQAVMPQRKLPPEGSLGVQK